MDSVIAWRYWVGRRSGKGLVFLLLAVVVSGLVSIVAAAAVEDTPAIRIKRTETGPVVDGVLSDPAWRDAARIEGFVQREPRTGEPASERTVVLITYDEENLYFGFHCYDSSPGSITAKEMARDADLSQDDRVQIILDTFLDRRTGYWFQIGPRGSIGDALISDNGAVFNKDWDTLWEGRAVIHDEGWDAEVAIPFQSLSFPQGSDTWGLKLIRHIKRLEESDYWPTANLDSYNFQVSDAGLVVGLEGIRQGHGLDIRPYGLGGLHHEENGNYGLKGDVGVDVFYRVTPSVQAALTVNTDFAETEADTRRTNLTRFPLFFPEKRDFFLDGASYFTFGTNRNDLIPFFSRRLRLDVGGRPIPILGGGKLTGQVGDWNLGFLGVAEDRNDETRGYGVARIRRNFGRESSVGFLGTTGNAVGEEDSRLLGADLRLATSRFRDDKNLALTLFGLWTDTDTAAGSDAAFGGELAYPNDFVDAVVGFQEIGDRFEPGLGFVPRRGIRSSYANFALRPRPERWDIRQLSFGTEFEYTTDLDNRLLTRILELQPVNIRFDSGDQLGGELHLNFEYLDEAFHIHPDHAIPVGEYRFIDYRATFDSARRRRFWFSAEGNWGEFYSGRRKGTELAMGYKVAVPVFLSVEWEQDRVYLPSGSFTATVSRFVANVLFSPDVTLYNYIQYDNLSRVLGWQSRFYWILQPGNEIIVVWNANVSEPWDQPRWGDTNARLKVNYNFRF